MNLRAKAMPAALAVVSGLALLAAGYGYRTHGIAVRGWEVASQAQANLAEAKADIVQKAALFRDIIMQVADVGPDSAPREIIEAVRDFVYRTNNVGTSGKGIPSGAQQFFMLGRDGGDQLCGGMATAFAWALTQLGIPTRVVQLAGDDFLIGRDMYQTHVTVETFVDGKWMVSDPTFNVSFDCSKGGKDLSIYEARACIEDGFALEAKPGRTQIVGKGRTVADYGTPYADLLVAIAPTGPRHPDVMPIRQAPHDGWLREALAQY